MAVKTQFFDEEFITILAGYRLGDFVRAQPISAGMVQTNYALETTQGKFIFRYYEGRSCDSVRFECNVAQYLKRRHYPCPAPLKNRQGKSLGLLRDKPFVLFEFIEGEHIENPTPAQEVQTIQKVAELNTLTRGYRPRGYRHRWNYGPALCRELAQAAAQRIGTANARAKLDWLLGELTNLDLPRALPKGVCHCDFHFSNILFKDGQFAALIDFDDANYTYLTFDLVTLLNPFTPDFDWDTWSQFPQEADIFDFRDPRRVVAEYMRCRPLIPIEKRHLFDVCKLSILIDCLWYFERGDAADFYEKRKIDALNRLSGDYFYSRLFS